MNLTSVTMSSTWQSWQDFQPGTFIDLGRSLQNYVLDYLFGPPSLPTAHYVNNESILQQVSF